MSKDYGRRESVDLDFFVNLSRAYMSIHRNICQVLSKYDLTSAQFGVLEALYHKGDLSVGEIVRSILTTSGNITVVIKNLEKDELVKRRISDEDRRVGIVSITNKGKKLVEEVFPEQLQVVMSAVDSIQEEDKKRISLELKKLWYKKE